MMPENTGPTPSVLIQNGRHNLMIKYGRILYSKGRVETLVRGTNLSTVTAKFISFQQITEAKIPIKVYKFNNNNLLCTKLSLNNNLSYF